MWRARKNLVRAQRERDKNVGGLGLHPRISRSVAGEMAAVTYSDAPFVEISAAGITKASALAGLCDRLGIAASQVIAFGDMPNDLPMLAWAGRSVAVANAHPEVLTAVDEVTAANEDDGVAVVLERLLAGVATKK